MVVIAGIADIAESGEYERKAFNSLQPRSP